jgi:hypothetical protein
MMAGFRANGFDGLEVHLKLPLTGRGTAKVLLTEDIEAGAAMTLEFDTGDVFKTTVTQSSTGRNKEVHAVLGTRGLEKTIDQRFYEGIPIETVIRDILRDSGEEVSSVNATGFFNQYQRIKSTAAQALKNVLNEAKLEYGYGFDGRVWVGLHQWQTYPETLEATSNAGASRMWCVDLNAALQPGFEYTIFDSSQEIQVRVEMVEHLIYAGVQETRLWGAYDY